MSSDGADTGGQLHHGPVGGRPPHPWATMSPGVETQVGGLSQRWRAVVLCDKPLAGLPFSPSINFTFPLQTKKTLGVPASVGAQTCSSEA